MPPYYLTTPIYYVNDLPHIGHIFTTVVADTLARYRRMAGDDVRFLTGTDEHGQNIERAAAREGVTPLQLADKVVARYHELWKTFGISHDDFIRTSEPRHEQGVVELIRRIEAAGDLYLAKHEGWYCSPCELFYTEKELSPGQKCPVHGAAVEWKSEENVFFRLAKYQQPLLDWIDANPEAIRPETRRNEVRSFVESGLRDLSVSRTGLAWGIPFPGYPGHTVYVWLDALANYITALGFGAEGATAGAPHGPDGLNAKGSNKGGDRGGGARARRRRARSGRRRCRRRSHGAEPASSLYRSFWSNSPDETTGPTRVHLMGKDILRFHAVYWPAFLMSAGLPLPTQVWAHGWWLRDSKKMSKSVGNVVRPDDLVARFGPDALRYYLLREMVFGQDANFSDEAFVDRFNSDLANDLGNTASRLVTVTRGAFDGRTPPLSCDENPLIPVARQVVADYRAAMDQLAFQDALRALWRLLAEANQYLVVREPWKMVKAEGATDALSRILWNGLEAVRIVATGLLPFMPTVARQVLAAVGTSTVVENLDAMAWGGTPNSAPLPELAPLFPRIDKEKFMSEIKSSAPEPSASGSGCSTSTALLSAAPPPVTTASATAAAADFDGSLDRPVLRHRAQGRHGPVRRAGAEVRQADPPPGRPRRRDAAPARGRHRQGLYAGRAGGQAGRRRGEPQAGEAHGRRIARHDPRSDRCRRQADPRPTARHRSGERNAREVSSRPFLIDSHCHLQYLDPAEQAAAIGRARARGVEGFLVPATELDQAETLLALCHSQENVWCAIGVHPHEAASWQSGDEARLRDLLADPKVVAVGECGLDFFYDHAPREVQEDVLRAQWRVAVELDLPAIVHNRDSNERMLAILAEPEFATLKADFHSFAGGREMGETVVAHGCMLGMSGMVTFPKADNVREVIPGTPHDRFLVETDTPYLAPVPHRGKPNEPSFIVEIATRLGLELGLDLAATAALTTENFFRFFAKAEASA